MAPFASIELLQMFTQITSTIDKELLDSLNKVGFRTNTGVKGTGINLLAWSKGGGYYLGELDVSMCPGRFEMLNMKCRHRH